MVFTTKIRENATIVHAPIMSLDIISYDPNMFGDGSQTAPKGVQLTDEEYEILEERQSQRRAFLTGRRRKDETREPASKDGVHVHYIAKLLLVMSLAELKSRTVLVDYLPYFD